MTETKKKGKMKNNKSKAVLEKAQEAYYEACSQQGSEDENTDGVRILAAAISIEKWLRLEQELNHIEVWRQAEVLQRMVTVSSYGLSEEQFTNGLLCGVALTKAYFEDSPSNYRGFMKALGVAGVADQLTGPGKGDLITMLQCFLLVVKEYETEDVIEKYTEDIRTTCISQLDGERILDQTEENAKSIFDGMKEDLQKHIPVPSAAPKQKKKRKKKNNKELEKLAEQAKDEESKPKQKKKRKKKNFNEKIEIMLKTMALIAIYVAGSGRKASEESINDKESDIAKDVSSKMFASKEWQDRLFERDLKPDELGITRQFPKRLFQKDIKYGYGKEQQEEFGIEIENGRERCFDELKEQAILLREHYTYSEDKDWDAWDREKSDNTQFMVHFATNVANASGGLLGFGKISKAERESITSIYKIIDPDDTLYEKNVVFRIDEIVKMIKKGECTL